MGHGEACPNHPDRKVLGCCHACQEWLCRECLQEGPLHYYCRKSPCTKALQEEMEPQTRKCPSCSEALPGEPDLCPGCGFRLKPVAVDDKEDLVTVMKFNTAIEAQLARTKLESEGIQAFVFDENIGLYTSSGALGGIRLKTAKSYAKQALQILGKIPE